MKKLVTILLFTAALFMTPKIYSQNKWTVNEEMIEYRDSTITVSITPSRIEVTGKIGVNVVLFDYIGHFIASWRDMKDDDKDVIMIYTHARNRKGWIRIDGHDIPTIKQEEYNNDNAICD